MEALIVKLVVEHNVETEEAMAEISINEIERETLREGEKEEEGE